MKARLIMASTPRKRIKKRSSKLSNNVVLVNSDRLFLRKLKLADHRHTGKVIHRWHTSYVVLVILLLIVGFFLFIGSFRVLASDNNVSISVIVAGPFPTVGATITNPVDGTVVTDKTKIEISGTCSEDLFVVIRNNSVPAGSTVCTGAGVFSLEIQLNNGENIISALNYDNYNQAGPITPSINVHLKRTDVTTPEITEPSPTVPTNPSIVFGVPISSSDPSNPLNYLNSPDLTNASSTSSCDDFQVGSDLPTSSEPHVSIVCMPRLFLPKITQTLGFLAWGGTPPYAVSIDWGDGSDASLVSIPTQGYSTKKFAYVNSGVFKINLKLQDNEGVASIVQAAIQVTGDTKTTTPVVNNTNNNLDIEWFKVPVPLYATAVAITLGFWGGDIFDRYFGARRLKQKSRKKSAF